MFETLSYLELQQYWWLIISILGALLVSLMFVQGGQTLLFQLSKTKDERKMLIGAIGTRWEITFTTLVTFGGAFFAAFPLFYSTSFGGAYWAWTILLFSFIIQAVSYEYRSKPDNFLGTKTYDIFLFINGILATLLVGVVVATFFTGSEFSIDKMRITGIDGGIISRWETPTRGLEALFNFTNLLLGLSVLFLSRVLGILYFMFSIVDDTLNKRFKKQLIYNTLIFLLFFLTFVGMILTADGFAYDPITKNVFLEPFKYLHNFLEMPATIVLFLVGVVLVLAGIFLNLFKNSKNGFWFTISGTFITVLSLLLIVGYNNTCFYPSTFDLQSSLTIENSSSSRFTLTVMSYVSIIIPFMMAIIAYTWRSLIKGKISLDKVKLNKENY